MRGGKGPAALGPRNLPWGCCTSAAAPNPPGPPKWRRDPREGERPGSHCRPPDLPQLPGAGMQLPTAKRAGRGAGQTDLGRGWNSGSDEDGGWQEGWGKEVAMRCWEGRAQATVSSETRVQGERLPTHLHIQVAHPDATGPLPGRPGSEARWIRGGRWKRPSGSPGTPRRGLSGVCRANTGLVFGKPLTQPLLKSRKAVSTQTPLSRTPPPPQHGAVPSRRALRFLEVHAGPTTGPRGLWLTGRVSHGHLPKLTVNSVVCSRQSRRWGF